MLKRATVTLLLLSSCGGPQPAPRAAPTRVVVMAESEAQTTGIEPGAAKRIMRANFPRLRACYEHFVQKRKQLIDGRLTFDLVLDADGSVASVHEDYSSSFDDSELLQCAAKVFASLRFPEVEKSGAKIHYPLDIYSRREE